MGESRRVVAKLCRRGEEQVSESMGRGKAWPIISRDGGANDEALGSSAGSGKQLGVK